MIDFSQHKDPSPQQLRSFARLMYVAGLVLVVVSQFTEKKYLLLPGVFLMFILIGKRCFPMLQYRAYRIWMGMAQIMAAITSRIILFVLFYFVFTPVALILRILNVRLLDLKFPDQTKTFWKKRTKTNSDLTKMY